MRVIKHVMEHLKTKGKNTITPRLFVKTKANNYKILELPGILFENVMDRDAASSATVGADRIATVQKPAPSLESKIRIGNGPYRTYFSQVP